MKLYIPDIKDKITLSSDWSFDLHPEGRNESLFEYFGYGIGWEGHIKNPPKPPPYPSHVPPIDFTEVKFNIFNPFKSKEDKMKNKVEEFNNHPDVIKFRKEMDEYRAYMKNNTIPGPLRVTLPKGTVLTVDRIYIRKGNKAYSSISFFAVIPGDTKKRRFWAKLKDCNLIEFS